MHCGPTLASGASCNQLPCPCLNTADPTTHQFAHTIYVAHKNTIHHACTTSAVVPRRADVLRSGCSNVPRLCVSAIKAECRSHRESKCTVQFTKQKAERHHGVATAYRKCHSQSWLVRTGFEINMFGCRTCFQFKFYASYCIVVGAARVTTSTPASDSSAGLQGDHPALRPELPGVLLKSGD